MNEIAAMIPSIQLETSTVWQIWQADEIHVFLAMAKLGAARRGVVE